MFQRTALLIDFSPPIPIWENCIQKLLVHSVVAIPESKPSAFSAERSRAAEIPDEDSDDILKEAACSLQPAVSCV